MCSPSEPKYLLTKKQVLNIISMSLMSTKHAQENLLPKLRVEVDHILYEHEDLKAAIIDHLNAIHIGLDLAK